ncbi:hypothetical protein NM208_g2726 [Fusarium decemcellulare]|uniref:Uncharacterized protein n=1 Tax=Fusarium decemcellulare TaxID=57161 RepID=A0ACC1SRR8_9HYPO|nr:hypothetical protein NM208_g2726 [Fusarium decemcellulare]
MCYFDQVVWPCGNWRWSSFRKQCNKEYRIGETCGLKLVYDRQDPKTPCAICRDITRKENRIGKTTEMMSRVRERGFFATVERLQQELDNLTLELAGLREQHKARITGETFCPQMPSDPSVSAGDSVSLPSVPVNLGESTESADTCGKSSEYEIRIRRRQLGPQDYNSFWACLSKTSAGIRKNRKNPGSNCLASKNMSQRTALPLVMVDCPEVERIINPSTGDANRELQTTS